MLGKSFQGFFSKLLRRLTTKGALGSAPRRPICCRSTNTNSRGNNVAPFRKCFRYEDPPECCAVSRAGAFSKTFNCLSATSSGASRYGSVDTAARRAKKTHDGNGKSGGTAWLLTQD